MRKVGPKRDEDTGGCGRDGVKGGRLAPSPAQYYGVPAEYCRLCGKAYSSSWAKNQRKRLPPPFLGVSCGNGGIVVNNSFRRCIFRPIRTVQDTPTGGLKLAVCYIRERSES